MKKPPSPLMLAVAIATALFGGTGAAAAAHHHGQRLPHTVAIERTVDVIIPEQAYTVDEATGRRTINMPTLVTESAGDVTIYIGAVSPMLWRYYYVIEGEWRQSETVIDPKTNEGMIYPNPDEGLVVVRKRFVFGGDA